MSGQLIPTFAYRDVDQVKFLGTSAWNSPDFPERVAQTASNIFFVDAFLTDHPSPLAQSYVEKYRTTFDQEPTAMDALAYDAGKILETLLSKDPSMDRDELRERLTRVKNFPGVTGKITFENGSLSRDLKVLTLKGNTIVSTP